MLLSLTMFVSVLLTLTRSWRVSRENLGELAWRIGVPLSALVLAQLVNPRAGRSEGRLSLGAGLLVVHGGMALVLALLFARRARVISLRLGGRGR